MRKIWVPALLIATGLTMSAPLGASLGPASAATSACPTTYVDAQPCSAPSGPSAGATVTIGAAPAAAAGVRTSCAVASIKKRRGLFTVTSASGPVRGGTLQVKLHRVGTPGTKILKVSVMSYRQAITRTLAPGRYHGTMIYKPAASSGLQYCGIVFRNLVVRPASRAGHRHLQLPNSVTAGLRSDAP